MIYKRWDIVLIPFPFTDFSILKKRPGLIISPNEFNKQGSDLVITFLTSKMNSSKRIGDYKLQEWEKSNLPKPTMSRMKFATISSKIIIKKIGQLQKNDIKGFVGEFRSFFKYKRE